MLAASGSLQSTSGKPVPHGLHCAPAALHLPIKHRYVGSQLLPGLCKPGSFLGTRLVLRGSKKQLDSKLEETRKVVDQISQTLQQSFQTGQALNNQPSLNASIASRELQVWQRQQALLDWLYAQWQQDRQAWQERERQLLAEMAQLRSELRQQLISPATAAHHQQQQHGSSIFAAGTAPTQSSAAAASVSTHGSAGSVNNTVTLSTGVISGPSSASAAVANAIRAVRDAGVNPPAVAPTTSQATSTTTVSAPPDTPGSWQDLFPAGVVSQSSSYASSAVDDVAAAIAAVDQIDMLQNLDLTYSRYRQTQQAPPADSNGSTSSSNGRSSQLAAETRVSRQQQQAGTQSQNGTSQQSNLSASSAALAPAEMQEGDPAGPPPVLAAGDDDIFWVSKLHNALMAAGFYPSEEEVENWMFGDGTLTALLTFQACSGIPETGTTDEATWCKLLGEEDYQTAYGSLDTSSSSSSSNRSSQLDAADIDTANASASNSYEEQEYITFNFNSGSRSSQGASSSNSGWPVLMDMDGGKEVHALQVSLAKAGYHCGDDEMRWWQFGPSTVDALKTFQVGYVYTTLGVLIQIVGAKERSVCDRLGNVVLELGYGI
eukprot:GHRR01023867.1.p1 GENE.GHRR01023867.1~~GHRR01023867.1.p1  ORF type:complete len:646 (+),score=252.77 GHRR01023867.1:133-1938(+)